jgi:flagellar M-ring protein FliF
MDDLYRASTRLGDLIRSMSPIARWTWAILAAVVMVSLVCVYNQRAAKSHEYLLGGHSFSAGELLAMEGAFAKAGLADHEVEASRVRVPSEQKQRYLVALAEADAMPANFGRYLTEAIAKLGPFTPRSQQEELTKIALEKELGGLICWMPGIERAAVLFQTPRKTGFHHESAATAMVNVKPRGSQPLNKGQIPDIKRLVASAINIPLERVTVVDANSHAPDGGQSAK